MHLPTYLPTYLPMKAGFSVIQQLQIYIKMRDPMSRTDFRAYSKMSAKSVQQLRRR